MSVAGVKMKSSGSPWIGKIPEHWETAAIKFLLQTPVTDGPHETPEKLSEGIPFVSAEAIQDRRINFNRIWGYISENDHARYSRKYSPKIDDIYMVKSGATTGRLAMVEDDRIFNIWSPLAAFRFDGERALPQFVFFALQSEYFQKAVELSWSYGTQQNIGMGVLANLDVSFPSPPEQRTIAAYLDEETGKIDRLVELRRRQIELLKEQRASLIQQAVTCGLDPNVKLKDSGIPWLGKIPEHWEMTKLKFLSRTASGSTPNSSTLAYYEGGTIGWIRTTDLNGAELIESPVKITEAAVQDTACKIVPEGSVLIAMYGGAGTIGKHAILRFDSTVNQAVCAILPSKKISPDYLHAFVGFYRPYWMVEAEGGRKDPNIGQDDIKNLELPLPPEEEQAEIVEFLIRKRNEIDTLVGRLDDSIDLLEKYRASLINECVTGQRRIPA